MDEEKKVIDKPEQSKKRRTAEEIAADRLAREKKIDAEAEAAKVNIEDMEKQIAAMQKKVVEEKKKLKTSRNTVRTHKAMKLYGDLVAMLGFDEMEKACATESDFDKLAVLVKDKVKSLIKLEKKISKIESVGGQNPEAEK